MTDEPDLLGEWPNEWLPDEEPPEPVAILPILIALGVGGALLMIVLKMIGVM